MPWTLEHQGVDFQVANQVIAGASDSFGVSTLYTCLQRVTAGAARTGLARRNNNGVGGTAKTATGLNSRSPAPPDTFLAGFGTSDPTIIGNELVILGMGTSTVDHAQSRMWRAPKPGSPVLVEPSATVAVQSTTNTFLTRHVVFSEPDVSIAAPGRRRGRRPGYGFYEGHSQTLPASITVPRFTSTLPYGPVVQRGDWPSTVASPNTLAILLDTGAVVFNDAVAGTITLSGTQTETHSHSISSAGTITLSGTRTESASRSSTVSGTIALSGSVAEQYGVVYNDSATGTITLSGTRAESATHSASVAGTVSLTGSATQSHSRTSTPVGTLVLSGALTQSHTRSASMAGTVVLGGSNFEDFHPPGVPAATREYRPQADEIRLLAQV